MANQVIPRLNGDEYQHLYSWYHVLSLLRRRDQVRRVRVEDTDAGSVDDVTVHHEPSSGKPAEFYHYFFQVKYHENQAEHYSSAKLMERKEHGRSLLQKFFDTWRKLKEEYPGREIKLYLVSNWSWNHDADKIGRCIGGQDGRLSDDFIGASPKSELGQISKVWKEHLGISDDEFHLFLGCLHLHLGEGSFRQLQQLVSERMEHVGLRHDPNALAVGADIIRSWIRGRQGDITIGILETVLRERDLYLPPSDEQYVTVYINTIAEGLFDPRPDFVLDWLRFFEGHPDLRGHQLKNPGNWNKKLLPELRAVLTDVRKTTKSRLVRARGLARLSAWFAFGYTFSGVAGFEIEVKQQDQHWRTDVVPAKAFQLVISSAGGLDGESLGVSSDAVACGISVTGSLEDDVRKHIACHPEDHVTSLLLIRPQRELGRDCLTSASDAVALALQTKELLRQFVKRHEARQLFLYYFGPLSGACFIGHQLNAVCRQIQIMEDQQPGYSPSFLLS